MNLMEALIAAKLGGGGGGGGGSVTPANVLSAIEGMSDAQAAAALAALGGISTDQLGTVFTFKGSKATYADLLLVQDPQIGDVWFVDADSANYVWIEDEANPNGFWDEFGQPIDLSAYSLKPVVTTVSGSTPTIALCEDNHIYECGELTSLTVTAIDNPGSFILRFISGATATTTTLPAGMVFPEAFAPEANTRYEINCVDGYALVAGWPYTPPAAEE